MLRLSMLTVLLATLLSSPARSTELDQLAAGHWLELRGQFNEQGIFRVERVDLIDPVDEEVLIGTLSASSRDGEYKLLGKAIEVSRRTEYSNVDSGDLSGQRVKVKGRYHGPGRFSAHTIAARGPSRERITGQISQIEAVAGGYSVTVMDMELFLAAEVELRREQPIGVYAVTPDRSTVLRDRELSEDDQFGDGIRLGENMRLTTMLETRYTGEDNFNLDLDDEENRKDSATSGRARLVLESSAFDISGQLEYRYTHLRRNDDEDGTSTMTDGRLGESFVFFENPLELDMDIQVGRMDLDDHREWIYDANLDGVRVFWSFAGVAAELSATTTLSDGNIRDQNSDNYVVYVTDRARRFAGYVVHRDTDLPYDQKITHYGVRAFGEWLDDHESWLELSTVRGRRDSEQGRAILGGWGMDLGTTRQIGERWFLTASWAYGQGDDDVRDGKDNNFRQTGLQDNNAKFGGVTSFRIYGELVDPELANLHIGTLGVGYRFNYESSMDIVGHYYRQDEASRKLLDAELDEKANGVDRELGWELDAILGWRAVNAWDFELVLAWFKPGAAFDEADDAWMSKLQLRFRY